MAGYEFFTKKKEQYKTSKVQDCKDLCNHPVWNIQAIDTRESELIVRLEKFFNVLR